MKEFTTDNPKAPELMEKAEELSEEQKAKIQEALKEASDIRAGINSGFAFAGRIPYRKRGRTHKQYIEDLKKAIVASDKIIADLEGKIAEMSNDKAMVPATLHQEALKKIDELRGQLIKYGLWLGE